MERSPFLPLPQGMVLGQVELTQTQLKVIATQPCARCPGCGTLSDAVHCQYQRTVQDVPCGGRRVVLRFKVRKFFCRTPTCPRKVFTEVSERLAPRLGMSIKASTLLRYLRAIEDAPTTAVTKLGIDDFSLRRADSYGTILIINLETRRPLDLLPHREASVVKPWLASHPDIQVVSRDR